VAGLRPIDEEVDMPEGAVGTFGLKPHLTDSFKLSPDPQFIDKVRDIVGVVPKPAGCGGGAVRR
jgi:hypothetical protein